MRNLFVLSKIKNAFTLAETLITLTIIGVIASLTIPVIKEFSEESQHVAAAKKAYSTASAATAALETKYGDVNLWPEWSNATQINNKYKEVMNTLPNVVQSYPTSQLNGSEWSTVTNDWFETTDGMTWYVYNYRNAQGSTGVIHVDTNGPQAPNRVGVDVLGYVVHPEGVFPLNDKVHDINYGWACTYYIIKTGKMPWIDDTSYADCTDNRITGI